MGIERNTNGGDQFQEMRGLPTRGEIVVPKKLYHGSRYKMEALEPRQAASRVEVPAGELLDAIYFTPDKEIALAMAARPNGRTELDGAARTISFDRPEGFQPDMPIYVYEVDTAFIPDLNIKRIDESQFAVVGLDAVTPNSVEEYTAKDVFKYFKQK
jgi:hypothetical protein